MHIPAYIQSLATIAIFGGVFRAVILALKQGDFSFGLCRIADCAETAQS